jgi:uncharacterized protein (DUF1697 family)
MTQRWVVLLKGVNVGGRRRVPMGSFRDLLGEIGAEDVVTHLNSGNAVLRMAGIDARQLEERVEQAILERLGLQVEVIARSGPELTRLLASAHELAEGRDASRLLVTFLRDAPDPAAFTAVDPSSLLPSQYWLLGRELVVWHPLGVSKEPVTLTQWERRLGTIGTARNWRTTQRLADLAGLGD